MNNNRCVSCGAIIPEGRQVCYRCMNGKIIRRVLTTAVALSTMATTTPAHATGNDEMGTLCMDVNYDDIIDGRDATMVLTEYAQTSVGKSTSFTETQRFIADTNLDGIVDGRDATAILTTYAYNSTHKTPQPIKTVTFTLERLDEDCYWIPLDKNKYFIEDLWHSVTVDSQGKPEDSTYHIDVKILKWMDGHGFVEGCLLDVVEAESGYTTEINPYWAQTKK